MDYLKIFMFQEGLEYIHTHLRFCKSLLASHNIQIQVTMQENVSFKYLTMNVLVSNWLFFCSPFFKGILVMLTFLWQHYTYCSYRQKAN